MKGRIVEMEPFPTTAKELKQVVRQLWDEMDPNDFMHHIEDMPQKLAAVIQATLYATEYVLLNCNKNLYVKGKAAVAEATRLKK